MTALAPDWCLTCSGMILPRGWINSNARVCTCPIHPARKDAKAPTAKWQNPARRPLTALELALPDAPSPDAD